MRSAGSVPQPSSHISLPIALHPGHSKEHGQIIMSVLMLSHKEVDYEENYFNFAYDNSGNDYRM